MLADLAIWNCRVCGEAFEPRPYQRQKSDRTCGPCRSAETMRSARRSGRPRKSFKPSPEVRALQMERQRVAYHGDPEYRAKCLARAKARKYAARGVLARQPCEVCGSTPAEAHHDDYAKPLSVRWLCPIHHREHHAAERAAARLEI